MRRRAERAPSEEQNESKKAHKVGRGAIKVCRLLVLLAFATPLCLSLPLLLASLWLAAFLSLSHSLPLCYGRATVPGLYASEKSTRAPRAGRAMAQTWQRPRTAAEPPALQHSHVPQRQHHAGPVETMEGSKTKEKALPETHKRQSVQRGERDVRLARAAPKPATSPLPRSAPLDTSPHAHRPCHSRQEGDTERTSRDEEKGREKEKRER